MLVLFHGVVPFGFLDVDHLMRREMPTLGAFPGTNVHVV